MKKTLLAALFLGTSIISSSVLATDTAATGTDGTINFTGKIVNTTCNLTGGGTKNPETVVLPTVNMASLAKTGDVAGKKSFSINLSNCSAANTTGINSIKAYFHHANNITAEGRLKTNKDHVNIEILDANSSKINLAADASAQTGATDVSNRNSDNKLALNYFAQYYATATTDNTDVGDVSSTVEYTIIYQ